MVKIVFLGTPAFAVSTLERLLASVHQVVAVVSQPDRPRGRGQKVSPSPVKQVAEAHGIPVLQPTRLKDFDFLQTLGAMKPDLGVVAAYGKILPEAVLALPRLGMINVHASLLPKYRGAAPIHRAVMAGETETGITIIRLVREMDAGPMLRKASRPIGPDETSADLEPVLAEMGADLLMATVEDLATGRATEEPQDHDRATLAPRLSKEDGLVDWTRSARDIHNQVRGLHPWPHAFSYLDDARLLIYRTAVVERPDSPTASSPSPGTIIRAAGDDLVVAAGSATAVAVLEIQPEGRRPVPARAFLAGHAIAVGQRLGSTVS